MDRYKSFFSFDEATSIVEPAKGIAGKIPFPNKSNTVQKKDDKLDTSKIVTGVFSDPEVKNAVNSYIDKTIKKDVKTDKIADVTPDKYVQIDKKDCVVKGNHIQCTSPLK